MININIPVIRVMTNHPALVGEGYIAVGKVYEVDEELMDVI